MPMLIAQITDTHLRPDGSVTYAGVEPKANFSATLEAITSLATRPDMLVLSGDLADKGEAGSYAWLDQELGRYDMPVYVIPGNHDLRAPMRQAFGRHGYLPEEGFMHYVVEAGPVRLVALDTVIEFETGGRMCADRCAWLSDRLAEDRKTPTVIMMHHQPFLTGGHFDAIGIEGRETLEAVVAKAPNVTLVICGHMHRGALVRWAGTVVSVCPSTAFQFDLDQADPTTFRVRAEPPAYQLHYWSQKTGMVTYTGTVGDFPVLRERPHE
jgi:3',5'-cyclic AMP phosphodiesterase CpdA